MIQKLLIVLLALSSSACVTTSKKDDSPASDLVAYRNNVQEATRPILLPNGKTYCAELAATEDAQDDCIGDLEDNSFAYRKRMEQIYIDAVEFVNRLMLLRNPCSRWEKITRRERCAKNSTTP